MFDARCGRRVLAASLVLSTVAGATVTREAMRVELRHERGRGQVVALLHADLDGLLVGGAGLPDLAARVGALEELRARGPVAVEAAVGDLAEFFRRRVRLRFGGRTAPLAVSFPDRRDLDGELLTLGSRVRVVAAVPTGATTVSFSASRALRAVDLIFEDGVERMRLEPGERSPEIALERAENEKRRP